MVGAEETVSLMNGAEPGVPCLWKWGRRVIEIESPVTPERTSLAYFLSLYNSSHLSALPRNSKYVRLLYSSNVRQADKPTF